jgi:hypothetical protein
VVQKIRGVVQCALYELCLLPRLGYEWLPECIVLVGTVTKKCGKMDLETEDSAKEAYEMQLYGFSSRTVCDCGNIAHWYNGPHVHVHSLVTFRRFSKSRRICNWHKECNATSSTTSIFVLTKLTVTAQNSLLQSINWCLKFVPQFVIRAGYVTFSSYCNISNVLFQNSVGTEVMMKAVQLQAREGWKSCMLCICF